jgi:CRP-like cAMP-binding protein
MPGRSPYEVHNRILAALPPKELACLRPRLQPIDLAVRQLLSKADTPIDYGYFPQKGLISLVRPMRDGSMVEVGLVGREGFVGLAVVLGGRMHTVEKMVQVQGSALRISARALREELGNCPTLLAELLRYTQALLVQISQTAACNGRHTIQERLARWLLMARDRNDDDVVPLSHEFLSMMLGARRSGITMALGALRQAGLIGSSHNKIVIIDGPGLEAAACECYGAVRQETGRPLRRHGRRPDPGF